jgi:NAD-dependent SIR2 family protein deacetylase
MTEFGQSQTHYEVQWKATPLEERWRTALTTKDPEIAEAWYNAWLRQGYPVQLVHNHVIPRILKRHGDQKESLAAQAVDAATAAAG